MIPSILPMLATASEPFDSPEHVFEVKWDGVRALAAVEGSHWRLWGRELSDYSVRYPELVALRCLPSGTVVDGELVVFEKGRANLEAILRRHQLVDPAWIRRVSGKNPVRYILFDILYHQGRSLLHEPYHWRRRVLADLLIERDVPELSFSEGIVGLGKDFYERVIAQGHEGIVAKHQTGRYLPGKRSSAWRKIKPGKVLPCLIIGYTVSRDGLDSLLVASAQVGPLRYVAQVTCGFSQRLRMDLTRRLARCHRAKPVVTCPHKALWVEAVFYCKVRFLQWTPRGRLRSASFAGLLE